MAYSNFGQKTDQLTTKMQSRIISNHQNKSKSSMKMEEFEFFLDDKVTLFEIINQNNILCGQPANGSENDSSGINGNVACVFDLIDDIKIGKIDVLQNNQFHINDSACDKSTTNVDDTKRTVNRTKNGEQTTNESISSNQSGKCFKCNYCDYVSQHKSYLVRHMTSHTWEKPFKCNMCSKAFSRSSKLWTKCIPFLIDCSHKKSWTQKNCNCTELYCTFRPILNIVCYDDSISILWFMVRLYVQRNDYDFYTVLLLLP